MARNTSKFSPMYFIDRLYEHNTPELAFAAGTEDEWREWRRKLKRKVWELLGGMNDPRCELQPEVVERKQMDGYTRERVIYSSRREMLVPSYVLIPDGAEPNSALPAVVAISGHGHGKDDLVGLDAKGNPRTEPSYQNDFAIQMVHRGFVVIAPEQLGFGERRDPWDIREGVGGSCQQHSMAAMLFGRTNSGMRVYDTMRAIDYLQGRPEVDPKRIGCLGISGGGLVTLFSAAMDERIKACLVTGYFNMFRDCIVPIGHCVDNYIPSILRYAEMPDIASLVAPRAFFSESGTKDPIFPIKATREAFARLQRVYELLGIPEKCGLHVFNDKHVFNGRKGMPFLEKWI
ncbi:MAG TPA: acetylxylan esterase [Armatimonadetes bacterium]|nr:acetylxylan esterase [Armatimonadota bacterium]